LQSVLQHQATGYGHGTCDRAHDHRGASREDLGGKSARRRCPVYNPASDRTLGSAAPLRSTAVFPYRSCIAVSSQFLPASAHTISLILINEQIGRAHV